MQSSHTLCRPKQVTPTLMKCLVCAEYKKRQTEAMMQWGKHGTDQTARGKWALIKQREANGHWPNSERQMGTDQTARGKWAAPLPFFQGAALDRWWAVLRRWPTLHWWRLWLSKVMDGCCRICELQDMAEYIYIYGDDRCCRICSSALGTSMAEYGDG